jgi:hypothetical protein
MKEGIYAIKATASYRNLNNITISALASDFITVKKRFGWWGVMDLLSWTNLSYLAVAALLAACFLVLIVHRKRTKAFEVRLVRIKNEDKELTMQVARFLRKYSKIPRPRKQGKPWKIPTERPAEETEYKTPPKKPGKKKETEKKKPKAKKHKAKPGSPSVQKKPAKVRKPKPMAAEAQEKSSVERLIEGSRKAEAKKPAFPNEKSPAAKTPANIPKEPKPQETRNSREEADKELVESLRSEVKYIESNLETLGREDISGLQKAAERLRRTLNFGSALGHETLAKTKKKLEKLKREYQAVASEG